MRVENETSENDNETSRKLKKLDRSKDEIRLQLSRNDEQSWTDLSKALDITSTGQLKSALDSLKEAGEIDQSECTEEHRNKPGHERCRKCYYLSGAGTISFDHIRRKLKSEDIRRDSRSLLRYLDMWIGQNLYDFSKFHTYDTIVEAVKLLRKAYKDGNIRFDASLTYGFLPKVVSNLKLTRKEKYDLNAMLENNLNDILSEFEGEGVGALIHTQGNVIAYILCSQIILGQISPFQRVKKFMGMKAMQSIKYDSIAAKYAPIWYILNKTTGSDSKCEQLLIADLKKHQTELIDMYALGENEDQEFLKGLLHLSERRTGKMTGND